MAKKQTLTGSVIQLTHDGADWRLRFTSFPAPEDTVSAAIFYKRVGRDEGQRGLTNGELNGSLRAFLLAREAANRAAEGF